MQLDYASRAERYARDVVEGRTLACKWVKAACQRHLDDLARVAAQDPDWLYYFDHEEANRVCQFLELLPHIKGDQAKPERTADGVHYPKIVLEDWQVFPVAVLFGWLRISNRLRRFRRAYLEVGRKNTKSTLLAGIGLYMLAGDGEQGPEVYASATKKDQARIVWEVAQEMVRRQPEFKQLGVGFNKSLIFSSQVAGKFTPLARDYGSLDGLNTSCFISDELHAQRDRKLYDVLDSSTGARSQPMGIGITTAGTDRAGVCYAQRTYVIKLLNAVLHRHSGMGYTVKGGSAEDETYFGIIYTLDTDYAAVPLGGTPAAIELQKAEGLQVDEQKKIAFRPDDDWGDEAMWLKANPMLAAVFANDYGSGLLDDLRSACQKARTMPSEQAEFRTKRVNQWLNADVAWMDMQAWNRCADTDLHEDEFAGDSTIAGLDAAFKIDIFANMKVFRRNDHYYVFGRYYAPERMLNAKGNEQLASWAQQGFIQKASGEAVDMAAVRDDLVADAEKHQLVEITYDPNQLTQFAGEMTEKGYTMVEIRPNVLNFSEPMKFLEELVLQGKLHHNGDPVLEWMVSNVVCHRDRKDGIYPVKEKPENKIDGVIGTIMALSRAMHAIAPAPEPRLVWL